MIGICVTAVVLDLTSWVLKQSAESVRERIFSFQNSGSNDGSSHRRYDYNADADADADADSRDELAWNSDTGGPRTASPISRWWPQFAGLNRFGGNNQRNQLPDILSDRGSEKSSEGRSAGHSSEGRSSRSGSPARLSGSRPSRSRSQSDPTTGLVAASLEGSCRPAHTLALVHPHELPYTRTGANRSSPSIC